MGTEIKDDLKPVEKEIDGRFYTFYYLKPKISFVVLSKIVKMIGPALSSVFSGLKEDDINNLKEGNFDVSIKEVNFDKAVKVLLDNLYVNDVQQIIDTLFEQTTCRGFKKNVNANYDLLFTGRLSHLFRVVKAALGVQYSDFFGGSSAMSDVMGMINQINPITEDTIQEM